ncbi:MAG: metal ABC transporter ATP-binding protein [Oscillospiraceae bacterium]|nr:metal ABC transporter ATP-binding protein [Oscillospiraceae bacterium]
MALLEIKDLAVGYDSRSVLNHLNFTVNEGDYLCIVGENGSGKSTIIRTILKLQDPISGEVVYGDGLTANEIGYLPQQTVVQKDFPASIREVVMSGLQGRKGIKAFYTKQDREEADRNMEKMGILDIADKCYRDLSGGQQQRVLLARALCATQKLLLLDEPVSGLDPQVTAEMYGLIDKLNKEGITVLMVSHDVQAAMKYASHILHVGDTVFFGKKEDYLERQLGKLYVNAD